MSSVNQSTLDHLKSLNRGKMEKAFNLIYQEYSYLVFYVSLSISHDATVSQDITNETFMKFYENRYSIKTAQGIKPYLAMTSKNLSINQSKKDSRCETSDLEFPSDDPKKDDFDSYIKEFSSFLSKEEVDLLVYRFLYDYKFKEIAKEKNASVDSITSSYKRALDKIKAHYRKEKKK